MVESSGALVISSNKFTARPNLHPNKTTEAVIIVLYFKVQMPSGVFARK